VVRQRRDSSPKGGAGLGEAVRRHLGVTILRELPADADTNGSRAPRHHGVPGAREEAAAGFPLLFGVGLPALREGLARGVGRRAAAVQALFRLVAVLPDTNFLHRGGGGGLAFTHSGKSSL